jgi:hypothetical protein
VADHTTSSNVRRSTTPSRRFRIVVIVIASALFPGFRVLSPVVNGHLNGNNSVSGPHIYQLLTPITMVTPTRRRLPLIIATSSPDNDAPILEAEICKRRNRNLIRLKRRRRSLLFQVFAAVTIFAIFLSMLLQQTALSFNVLYTERELLLIKTESLSSQPPSFKPPASVTFQALLAPQ